MKLQAQEGNCASPLRFISGRCVQQERAQLDDCDKQDQGMSIEMSTCLNPEW
jgi:hypothetical protein